MKKESILRKRKGKCFTKIFRIMRLTVYLLLVGLMQLQASTYAQNTKFQLKMVQVTIDDVIREIKASSEFEFFYSNDDFDVNRKVTVNAKDATVQEILDDILKETGMDYKVVDNIVVITPKAVAKPVAQQTGKKVTGTVIDDSGLPLPGVTIQIKGTAKGIITDMDGKYTIGGIKEDDILVFSFIGMRTQEIAVAGQSQINVTLMDELQDLEEVVVVGYGTQKKVNLTGAVKQVSTKELEDRTVSTALKSLQGAIPNLNISYSSGNPTATPNINIRGYESLSGGEPLVVIDGVPASLNEFREINPNDIASVSTLMDAASAAIYGSRAAFGVVLVTTKSGDKEGIQVSYNNYLSFKKPTVIPEFIMEPNTVMRAKVDATGGWYTLKDVFGINDWDYLDKATNGEIPAVSVNPEDPTKYLYAGRTNWYEEAMRDYATAQSHNLSISGKSKLVNYYMSAGYVRENGLFEYGNDVYDKYNLRSKLDFHLTDWLTLSNNSSYNHDVYDEPSQGFNLSSLYNTSTTNVIQNPDGSWTSAGASLFGAASEGGRSYSYNSRFWTSFTAKAEFWDKLLTLTAKATFMRGDWTQRTHWLPVEYKTGPDEIRKVHPEKDAQRKSSSERQNVYDIFANINKSFNDHHFQFLVGYNQEYRYYEIFNAYRKDLISSSIPSIGLATGEKEVGESISDWATRSGFFRVNYDFAGKYLVEVNGRYDGSSRFPQEDRFVFVPSVSLGWNLTNEKFFPENNILTSVKPRFSLGRLGNQDVGAYEYLPTMSSGKTTSILPGVEFDQQMTIYAPGIVASSLTWEKVTTTNYGVDLGFFNNKLTGSFDYYHRATTDMLTKSKQLPGVLGTEEPKENAADLITKGWELVLNWKDDVIVGGSPLNYNIGVTLADSRAWITKFDNPEGRLNDHYVGKELGEIWGYEVDGLFQSAEELAEHANQSSFWTYPGKATPGPGDMKFNDLNGDGQVRPANTIYDTQDQRIIGNSSARYHTGIRASANWKGFDFSMFWQGVLKADWYPNSQYFWGLNMSPWTNLQKYNYENSWTPDNPDAYLPRLKGYAASWWSGAEMLRTNTRYLQDAWYMRLKNITLGYNLPKNLINKINIEQLRVFVSGENLVTYTGIKNPNIDPEAAGGAYPLQKMFSFGMNLKF